MSFKFFFNLCLILLCICGFPIESSIDTNDGHELHTVNILDNETNHCQSHMDLQQIQTMLKLHPCALIQKSNGNRRMKRQVDAGSVDVHALQTTINDHRTMINYLINNSINATFVSDAISTHYSGSGPILTSWRDLIDLICIILFIGFIVYFLLSRAGFNPCNTCCSFFWKCLFPNMHEQKNQQQQFQQQVQEQQVVLQQLQTQLQQQEQGPPQQEIIKSHSIRRKKQHFPTVPPISGDIFRFENGYMSD